MLKVGKRMLYFMFELFCNLTLFIILMFENKITTKRTYKIEQLNNRKYNMQQLIKSKHSIIRLYLELMIF